jgi:hypothetical protein
MIFSVAVAIPGAMAAAAQARCAPVQDAIKPVCFNM